MVVFVWKGAGIRFGTKGKNWELIGEEFGMLKQEAEIGANGRKVASGFLCVFGSGSKISSLYSAVIVKLALIFLSFPSHKDARDHVPHIKTLRTMSLTKRCWDNRQSGSVAFGALRVGTPSLTIKRLGSGGSWSASRR
ncbi:MAG: hypothetical protein CVU39_24215 [Chloroflexi bacterium HGW-Chloroflexi-10]|nr:MAG: hypothetical protein CVU39_24215 [Chloroflexi bacterium HGW-Chloroflexi-10]